LITNGNPEQTGTGGPGLLALPAVLAGVIRIVVCRPQRSSSIDDIGDGMPMWPRGMLLETLALEEYR
jgi:hypothetical protein